MTVRKCVSCVVYQHRITSSSSDYSVSSSSSENSDTPLKRFNRLLRSSVRRHWSYFRKDRPGLRLKERGRSVSDVGLSSIIDNDREPAFQNTEAVSPRRSLQVFGDAPVGDTPDGLLFITSASGAGGTVSLGAEEASDSDAERPRKGHHLRVPTPAFTGHGGLGGVLVVLRSRQNDFAQKFDISVDTVRRTLHKQGIHHPKPEKKPSLSEVHK